MRNVLNEYYRPTQSEFTQLWDNCFFVFDTNILLNLYRYSVSSRNSLFEVLRTIQDRSWIPYQVAKEFHTNRVKLILDQIKENDTQMICLSKFKNVLVNNRNSPHISEKNLQSFSQAEKLVQDEFELNKREYESLLTNDTILDEITKIFDGRTGNNYDQDKLANLIKEFEERYKKRIPPGFQDKAKPDDRKYGDALIWYQIIDEASKNSKPVILVTGDKKDDWWNIVSGKTIGPLPELISEIKTKAKVNFYMYEPDAFLQYANEYLKLDVKEDTINEVKDVSIMNAVAIKNESITNITDDSSTFMNYEINELYDKDSIKPNIKFSTNALSEISYQKLPHNISCFTEIIEAARNGQIKRDELTRIISESTKKLDDSISINNILHGIKISKEMESIIESQKKVSDSFKNLRTIVDSLSDKKATE